MSKPSIHDDIPVPDGYVSEESDNEYEEEYYPDGDVERDDYEEANEEGWSDNIEKWNDM